MALASRSLSALIMLIALWSHAQAQYRSELFNNPDLIPGWVDTNASFWFSAYDDALGGFYKNIARDGSVIEAWGTGKDVLTQSRNAYAMVRAFQLTGNDDFLSYARGGLDFMYAHGWDPVHGGWLNRLSETGMPERPNDKKTAFYHHYALLGPMAMVEATDSDIDWEWLLRGYAYNEAELWDSRDQYFGYYDEVNRDGSSPNRKSFNATVDAVTTHALQLYLITGDEIYLTRLRELADNMLTHLVGSMDQQAIGFAEKYNTNWGILPRETLTIMGHVLKTGWCLARINQIAPNPDYVDGAERLVNHVLENGYDHQYGAPYKDYNRTTGELILWGIADTTKAWWQVEQAIVAGLELHRTTGDATYLEMADESLDFFTTFFQDSLHGEVYFDRTRYGDPIPQWGDHKGNDGKAGYHSVETGYYAYLYAKLYLHQDVATLHYKYDAASEDRSIALSPLSAPASEIIIASVRLDGVEYTDFDAATRTLHLPAGIAGHVEVDFVATSGVAVESEIPADGRVSISGNYPNPFTDRTTVELSAEPNTPVELTLYDVTGRLVARVWSGRIASGSRSVNLALSGLAPGAYMLVMTTPADRAVAKILRSPVD